MPIIPTPQSSGGLWKAVRDSLSLFGNTNKTQSPIGEADGPLLEEYESSMPEEKIMELVAQWKQLYSTYYSDIKKDQKLAFDYWVGKQTIPSQDLISTYPRNLVDNVLFTAIETFLPIATRANPEPVVRADPSDEGQELARIISVALAHQADVTKLRRKLAKTTRQWLLNSLGVVKISWNPLEQEIETCVINPKKMILDPTGYVDEGGHFVGDYLGEYKECAAEDLIKMFPAKEQFIRAQCENKLGTKLTYIEWWYCGTDVFYELNGFVLGKYKNPNWNYDGKETIKDPETNEELERDVQGTNFLKCPTYPYLFLSVFSTGNRPHDNTNLVLQNLSIQDTINRRWNQIDKNVQNMNDGLVVSGRSFTEEQAAQAASALRRGVAIRVPDGNTDAVVFPQRSGLPQDVFENLQDARSELMNVFGTSGSTPEAVSDQKTVRGKIMINQLDSSRIGGGITEAIEQLADSIYNYWIQMMFVYYDQEHYFTAVGANAAEELVSLSNSMFLLPRTLSVTVKEGSLVPKDPLTQRNEAMDLWSAGAIDPLNFYKRLDVPNPQEMTQSLILWQMVQKGQLPPQAYLPTLEMAGGQGQLPQQGVGGPAVNPLQGPQQAPTQTPANTEPVQQQEQQLISQIPTNGA